MRTAFSLLCAATIAAACTPVEGDRITGLDLARADARFAAVPQDAVIGLAPIPSVRRILGVERLSAIARAHGIASEVAEPLCFERPTHPLDEAKLRAALDLALGEGSRLELLEFSRLPVPNGEIVFRLSELPRPTVAAPNAAVTWRGRVIYGNSSIPVWAKVHATRLEQWVETTRPLPARQTIEESDVKQMSGWRFPSLVPPVKDIREVVGHQLLRSIRSGAVVAVNMLIAPNDVERGDTVELEVVSGAVTLKFDAKAETGGHRNETVLVTAASGKRFQARVQEKGKVIVDVDRSNRREVRGAGSTVRTAQRSETSEADSQGRAIVARSVSR